VEIHATVRITQRTGHGLANPSKSVSESARSRLGAAGGCRAAGDNFSGAAHFAPSSYIYIRTATNVKSVLVGKPFLAIE
jgi:hypothetical protein